MTEQGQPSPQRIGDAERDTATELLREHMAQGRLSAEEFDERIDAALKAKLASDLDPLFSDLPGPRPGQTVATTQPYETPPWAAAAGTSSPAPALPAEPAPTRNPALGIVTAVMWPAMILLISAIGWADFWWLIFVPVIISSVFGKDQHDRRDQERERIEREQRRLDERRRAIGD